MVWAGVHSLGCHSPSTLPHSAALSLSEVWSGSNGGALDGGGGGGGGGVLILCVDFKKAQCRPVEFKKCSCRPVEFKKCPMSLSL